MRKEVEQILRMDAIIKSLSDLQHEYNEIFCNCEHDVVFEYNTGFFTYRKCLFCQYAVRTWTNKLLCGKSRITIYVKHNNGNIDRISEVFELLKELFINTALLYPDKDLDNIVEIVKNKISKKDKDFCKLAKKYNVDYKKWSLTKEE